MRPKCTLPGPNPSGICLCGRGRPTTIASKSHTKAGWVAGCHKKFLRGHSGRKSPVDYLVVDRGYATPCWEWQGSKDGWGYGTKYDPKTGKPRRAHIVFWERENGPVPDGLELDHLCRNPPCVRTSHLEPVTQRENVYRSRATKLTDEQVTIIVARATDPAAPYGTRAALAREFGVTKTRISQLARHGRTR